MMPLDMNAFLCALNKYHLDCTWITHKYQQIAEKYQKYQTNTYAWAQSAIIYLHTYFLKNIQA